MTLEDHLANIRDFTGRSENEFNNGGNMLVAAELLWGALAHGLIAAADLQGWRCEGHMGYGQVAIELEQAHPTGRWRSDVAAGEQLHTHFYQGHLGPGDLQSRRVAAAAATDRLVSILEGSEL